MRRRKAFLIADAVIGIAIVAVLSVSLIGALGRRRQAAQKLSDLREATRAAEATLTELQAGGPAPASGSGKVLRPLAASATPGLAWVEVEATVGSQRAVLAGVVPAGRVPAGQVPGGASTKPSDGEAP